MKLIVGLGNPGRVYAGNRHNVGFRCLNHFARLHSIGFDRKQCRARVGIGEAGGDKVLLAKPATFMNLSGKSVACLMSKYDIPLSGLLVIHDDLDLPVGKIRVRAGGGSGGHRGMNSIIEALESVSVPRIRVGIGRPSADRLPAGDDGVVDHVLSSFSPQEESLIRPCIASAAAAIDCFLREGIESAMNRFN